MQQMQRRRLRAPHDVNDVCGSAMSVCGQVQLMRIIDVLLLVLIILGMDEGMDAAA
jgi:hypothetical protein